MALTIAIEGTGVLSNAESITNWGVAGAGGVSISLNTETFIQGSNSVASKIASGKYGWIYYDYGTAVGTLDFNGGNADGEYVYIWFNTTTVGFIGSFTQGGLSVRLGTDSSNYRSWIITSSDLVGNSYKGGWACAVINPTTSGSADNGTYSADTVNYLGIYYWGIGNSVAQNVFVDAIAVGKGLRITGTDATGWQEVSDYCNASPSTRVWGMMQEKLGVYFVYGKMFLGNSTQTADTSMTDEGRIFRFGDWEYATASTTYVSALSSGFNGLTVEDAASYKTTYVETGSFIQGSADADTSFDFYGSNNATSVSTMNGVTWQKINGTFTWGNDSDHSATNCVWSDCAEIDFVGAVVVRGCTFKNYSGEFAAVLYNTSWDVRESQFIDNDGGTNSAGVRHINGTAATYYDLTFSGNDWDVYLNHASDNLTISKDGTSNPSTHRSSGSGSVTFIGTVSLKLIVKDSDGNALVGARCLMEADSGGSDPHLVSVTITRSGTTASVSHTSHGMSDGEMVNIRGANQPEYDGAGKIISNVTTNAYDYTVSGSPATPATGTITATQCYISEVTIAGGIAEESYNAGSTQPYRGVVAHSTAPNLYDNVTYSGSDCSGGLTLPIQMGSDE